MTLPVIWVCCVVRRRSYWFDIGPETDVPIEIECLYSASVSGQLSTRPCWAHQVSTEMVESGAWTRVDQARHILNAGTFVRHVVAFPALATQCPRNRSYRARLTLDEVHWNLILGRDDVLQ